MKYVKDYISKKDITSWTTNQPVVINAKTGTGKSSFVFGELYEWAKENSKKILIFVNRTYLLEQFDYIRKGKEETIDIFTYQSVEDLIYFGRGNPISNYDIVVCDEAHYPFADSSFNWLTDLTLHAILSTKKCLKVFLSATADIMIRYLHEVHIEYQLNSPEVYNIPGNDDYIRNLIFYKKDDQIRHIINEVLKRGEKALIFINSKEKLFNLYKEYEEQSLFICSVRDDTKRCFVKAVEACRDDIGLLLSKRSMNKALLFSTTVLDNGISIEDDKLHTIICDLSDLDTIVQCVGRKRMKKKNDILDIYIKDMTMHQLSVLRDNAKELVYEAEVLQHKGEKAYIDEFVLPKKRKWIPRGVVYVDDGHYKINRTRYFKEIYNLEKLNNMINGYKDPGGRLVKAGWRESVSFKLKKNSCRDYKITQLEEYLAKNEGSYYLSNADRKPLIEYINYREDGHLKSSLKKINLYLESCGIQYRITLIPSKCFPISGKAGVLKQYQNIWQLVHV